MYAARIIAFHTRINFSGPEVLIAFRTRISTSVLWAAEVWRALLQERRGGLLVLSATEQWTDPHRLLSFNVAFSLYFMLFFAPFDVVFHSI